MGSMETEHVEDCDASAIEGWTKEEKFYLLQGLKSFMSNDIEHIQEYLTTKTTDEILAAIAYYKQKANKHPVFNKTPAENVKENKPRVPLASWAKLLTDSLSFSELHTETSTAVRMIADLEVLPPPSTTENIDFKTIYHEIANAMEGKSLLRDKSTCALLSKCIVETAMSSKSYIKNSTFKNLLSMVNLSDKYMNVYPRPTENHELSIIRHLSSQKNYNPLNIPEDYLKSTYENISDERIALDLENENTFPVTPYNY